MKRSVLVSAMAVLAASVSGTAMAATSKPDNAPNPAQAGPADVITTGVAKGRDRLDSATSTSVLREADIAKIGAASIGELLRDVPGIRSEADGGDGVANISIRGLPIATSGAKFIQLQEDGLPILEFGDVLGWGADSFVRADLNLAQLEVIRGGSASTFASNSPGGIINFISKTGEVEGGAIALSSGIDHNLKRADFDYGAHVGDTLRFHIGGFFRQGEGPRKTGYDAFSGGQVKLNVTKEFTGGYVRFYGKYLDDRTPEYDVVPMRVTGSNDDPSYTQVPAFDANNGTIMTKFNPTNLYVDAENNVTVGRLTEGRHSRAKTFGIELRADVAGWTVTEKFRYADIFGSQSASLLTKYLPAQAVIGLFGAGSGTQAVYATGPQSGQVIANPSALNGNGLLTVNTPLNRVTSLDNVTNDIRASRVWPVGEAALTTTVGFYASRQQIRTDLAITTAISDVRGDGNAALVDLIGPAGQRITQNGYYSYNLALARGAVRRFTDMTYNTNAPFASANFHIGKVSIGASIRYDYGKAQGQIFSADLGGGRVGNVSRDMNGDGVISAAETRVSVIPISSPGIVDYNFNSLSYSTGINFRIAEPLAVFARYSRGNRANADRLLYTPIINSVSGSLNVPDAAVDAVKQAEGGVKYRQGPLTLNATAFWAKVTDSNFEIQAIRTVISEYTAKGIEFEGAVAHGSFSLNAGATYTDANISGNVATPEIVGNRPRRQANFIFQATPQVTVGRVNVGAVFIGTTGSYAQNVNQLKMPGYVTTNAFVQVRPTDRLLLSLNASNLFDTKAVVAVEQATLPASGIVEAHLLTGRAVSVTARLDF
jgi:outer membrane receptor protein involved in Fe transport